MGAILTAGVFNEDFNYGYPYSRKVPYSPDEFTYDVTVHTHQGTFKPSPYARRSFSLHYASRKTEPNNYDKGVHGGSQSNNFYYLMFPIMQWDQVHTMQMRFYLTAAATLSYDRAWDGNHRDVFHLIVNHAVMKRHEHSAGHGWTTDSVSLRRGWNTVAWVLKTASWVPPITRGGRTVPGQKAPSMPRYLRLTNINISGHVQNLPTTRYASADFIADSTMGVNGVTNALSGPVPMEANASLIMGKASNAIFMTAQGTFDTNWIADSHMGQCIMQAESTMTVDGSLNQNHEAYDGGFEMGTNGELTVEVPIDVPQTVFNLLRPLQTITVQMNTPYVVGGIPLQPTYHDAQPVTITSGNAWTPAPAPVPATPLPASGTYRWLATDVLGADDTDVTSWPEHSGGPAWQSSGVYTPSVHPYTYFHTEGLAQHTLSRVVHFWWRYVQHMWLDMNTTFPAFTPFTWTFCGIFHPITVNQWNYIFDIGVGATPQYQDQVDDGEQVMLNEGVSAGMLALENKNHHFAFGIHDAAGVWHSTRTALYTHKPMVITVVWANTTSKPGTHVYIHGHRLYRKLSYNVSQTNSSRWLLGRRLGTVSHFGASHMSLMEVGYHNRALSDTEVGHNANHLMATYDFNRYG